jgi:type IV secretion system protein VirB10
MTRKKAKRSLHVWFVVPVAILGFGFLLMSNNMKGLPAPQQVDQNTVAAANGAGVVQAAKQAESQAAAKARAAANAAAAAAISASGVATHDPNAAATAAIAGNGAGDPNSTAAQRAAQQQKAMEEAAARKAEQEKADQKAAEIASAEILANNVQTMRPDTSGAGGGSSSSQSQETPQQLGDRLTKRLNDSTVRQSAMYEKALQVAQNLGQNGANGSGNGGGSVAPIALGGAASQDRWLASQGGGGDLVLKQHAKPEGYIITEGTPVRTVLVTGLDTDTPGVVTAQVTSDIYDSLTGTQLLIPRGSRVMGSYDHNVRNGQDRVLVALTRLIWPDGTWVELANASGAEMNGQSGLEGDVNSHFFKMFGSALIIGAASTLLDKTQQTVTVNQGLGTTQTGGTVFAQALNSVVNQLLQQNRDIPPTITRDAGTEFIFMVRRDMSMTPYHRTNGAAS